jgi:hypothetical protein
MWESSGRYSQSFKPNSLKEFDLASLQLIMETKNQVEEAVSCNFTRF